MAQWNGSAWASPVVVATNVSGNWADFPSIAASSANDVAAIWSRNLSADSFGTETLVARSSDGGRSWAAPRSPHDDRSDTIHGFSSLVALSSGSYGLVWLDGRKMKPGTEEGEMTVRYAELSAGGNVTNQKELDSIVCECCQTGLAAKSGGAVAVYRDRSAEGVRDIALTDVASSKSLILGPDGWKIDGCPVNGPQIDARGNLVVAAWFTGAPEPRVRVAFSGDGGKTFGDAVDVASGSGVKGRVDVVLLDDGEAIVTWLRSTAAGTELFATKVSNGAASSATRLASAAASAVPRMAKAADGVYVTWTDAGKPPKVRIGRMISRK